jgi:ABC-type lipoprotein release transport system permease subunit
MSTANEQERCNGISCTTPIPICTTHNRSDSVADALKREMFDQRSKLRIIKRYVQRKRKILFNVLFGIAFGMARHLYELLYVSGKADSTQARFSSSNAYLALYSREPPRGELGATFFHSDASWVFDRSEYRARMWSLNRGARIEHGIVQGVT